MAQNVTAHPTIAASNLRLFLCFANFFLRLNPHDEGKILIDKQKLGLENPIGASRAREFLIVGHKTRRTQASNAAICLLVNPLTAVP